jgi:hypothetical protein
MCVMMMLENACLLLDVITMLMMYLIYMLMLMCILLGHVRFGC